MQERRKKHACSKKTPASIKAIKDPPGKKKNYRGSGG